MILTAMGLCTSNVTQRTAEICAAACKVGAVEMGWPAMTMASYREGWFTTVPERQYLAENTALPEDLLTVLLYARNLGVDLIRFDKDADTDLNLPTYDW